jgi:transcriptional regulator with XRE-family HTH domain
MFAIKKESNKLENVRSVRFLVDKVQFGNYIREKRVALGLSQEELAEKIFISATAISKWENGKTYPDITIISLLCKTLKISEHEFVTAADDTELRKQAYQAQKYLNIKRNTKIILNALFALPVIICFIVILCNLKIAGIWQQFAIELFGISIGYSLLALPFMIEKERSLFAISGATVGTFGVIISNWFYAQANRFETFSLKLPLLTFFSIATIVWIVWAITRFAKRRLGWNFIAIGLWIACMNSFFSFFTGESANVNPPFIDLIIAIGLVIAGICLWEFERKRTK